MAAMPGLPAATDSLSDLGRVPNWSHSQRGTAADRRGVVAVGFAIPADCGNLPPSRSRPSREVPGREVSQCRLV